ncbi:ribonuclease III domain-containing protein [Trichophaea hybrida]|nr:ribonuclease III domain-containing protein [Trichophaea hybrida]
MFIVRRARGSTFQLALTSNAKRKSSSAAAAAVCSSAKELSTPRPPQDVPFVTRNLDVALRIPSVAFDMPPLYKFKDEALERRVYTHTSAGVQKNNWSSDEVAAKIDNQHLEFVGDGILKGLTAHLIDTLFPNLNEGEMSRLMATLINNKFYAHLARKLGLADRLVMGVTAGNKPLESERVLGGLFEAYVGGMHRDMGMERYQELYVWFNALLEPYAIAYQKELEAISAKLAEEKKPQTSTTANPSETSTTIVNDSPANPYLTRKDPGPITKIFTHAMWLHQYTTQNYLTMPDYSYLREGPKCEIRWKCAVLLDNQRFVGPPESSKAAAKNSVCKQVYEFINSWSERRGSTSR